jgi:hypothetical protein
LHLLHRLVEFVLLKGPHPPWVAPQGVSPPLGLLVSGLFASSIGTSGGAFPLSATDHYSSQEYKRAPDAYLDSGDHKAHVEVAAAYKGDGEQLETNDPKSHVERQVDVRYEERQGVQDSTDERGEARDGTP